MGEDKIDRRVQRTRDLLRRTIIDLIREKGYDAITIQDITERANLGRTTFYLHYQSKDDLLLDHHADFMTHFNLNHIPPDQICGDAPQAEMIAFLQQFFEGKAIYLALKQAKDAHVILRGIRETMTHNLVESLRAAFPDRLPNMPLDVLANYIAGAQLSLVDWWLTTRTPYTAEQLAAILQQCQRAIIRDAYRIEP
ncbi:MAG: TetR/AcrR family transcriptional regulator [Anaerolineae bacterium]|nr:TetR/AcrR family transcriptional regulator [Anaerolineae bacterium]